MDTTIDQQVAMDEALVPTAQRLKIGRSNFRLLSDIKSKESTLQLVYDVLRICPFFKAFLIIADRNVDYAYMMWEDFVYQVEHKNQKKSNEMYYPRFTKAIIHHFMSKDPLIPRRNKVNWHYVRDDHMFSTIKLVSRHQNTQQFGALLPIELTNAEIRNSKAYKEYYAIATGEAVPNPKASMRRTRSSSDTSITPLAAAASPRLTASSKGNKQPKQPKPKVYLPSLSADEGTGSKPGVPDVPTDESKEELSWNSTDDEGDDNKEKDADRDEEDEGDDEVVRDDNKEGWDDKHESDEETRDEESFDPIPQTPEDSDDEGDGEEDLGLNIGEEERHNEEEEEDELYRDVNINQGRGIQATLIVEDSYVTLTPVRPDGMESIFGTTSQMDVQTPTSVAPLRITAPTMTSSTIATTKTTSQAPIFPTTVSSTIIQNLPNFGSLFRFDDRLRSLEENFSEFRQTNQFAGAVSSIPGIVNHYIDQQMNEAVRVAIQIQSKVAVNEQLEAEVLTRSSHSSRTSYDVATDLSEMELKKILIKKIEGNEEPSARPDRGSKRCREGKEPESASAPTETATRKEPMQTTSQMEDPSHLEFDTGADDQSIVQSSQHPEWFSQQQKPPTLDRDWNKTLSAVHESIQLWISELAKQANSRSSFDELMDTPLDFSNFLMNRLKVDTLTPELLAGPTYELMKGSCKSLIELEYHLEEVFKATTDQLDWVNPEELKIVEWHSYKLLDWITVRRDDDKLYKFKEGDFKRLRIQDIEDMLLLLIQGKLTNLTVEERSAFNKKLNLTKPDTYRSDLKRKEAYTAYSNPREFIYQNKDKRNRLMHIDGLHKFSDRTLIDVSTALDDRLKGIRMWYLPQTIWRKSDKDRAAAMI
nr:hypothetical protein [Tanacetum cinerariifolium]